MTEPAAIETPAGFVPAHALTFGQAGADARFVHAGDPLPVRTETPAASSAPLVGSTSATAVAGPFVPDPGRPIRLTLTGTWSGSVAVQRSIDGGATKLPLTLAGTAWATFTANANEEVAQEYEGGATYYLAITLSSGTLTYRVAQ
ncbi:MAG: hypothetical protein JWM38_1883 [Sphingomonas bacterium]|nr:hypothetical protein [Sphingomonas bacterium]MDB5718456.1 hypothetical protein [Sphingomonas bacterium]